MSNKEQIPFQFAIVRYVHNILAGEFINIGIVMWQPITEFVDYKLHSSHRRMANLWPGFDIPGYWKLYEALEQHFFYTSQSNLGAVAAPTHALQLLLPGAATDPTHALQLLLPDVFRHMLPEDASCFQLSSIRSGVSPNPDRRLSELFEDLVLRHNS